MNSPEEVLRLRPLSCCQVISGLLVSRHTRKRPGVRVWRSFSPGRIPNYLMQPSSP